MIENKIHSFVIPVYKESPYLEECIRSLKKQSMPSTIILTTSTPSDFSREISAKHELALQIHEGESGIGSDWSFAYDTCRTKYVTIAHQDDVYNPKYTEACLSYLEGHESTLIAFTDYYELRGEKLVGNNANLLVKKLLISLSFLFTRHLHNHFRRKLLLSFGNPISCPSVMFNKGKIGDFIFSRSLSINLDWDAWLRLSKMDGCFTFISRKLLIHRIHAESETSYGFYDHRKHHEDELMFYKLWPAPIAKMMCFIYRMSYKSLS